jgi:hypothetical protein
MIGGMDEGPVVADAVAAIGRRNWKEVRALLHPYLHWTCSDGRTLRGRNTVLRYLADTPPSGPPAAYELRDGQVYRWIE